MTHNERNVIDEINFSSNNFEIENTVVEDKKFERTARAASHFIIYDFHCGNSVKVKNIAELINIQVQLIRSENKFHFTKFEAKLKKAFRNRKASKLSNVDWFQLTFEEIIEIFTEYTTWRSFLNTFNSAIIVKNACSNVLTESEKSELKSRMNDVSVKIINRKFRRFIVNKGGFEKFKNARITNKATFTNFYHPIIF